MFFSIFYFELQYWWKRPAAYIYFFTFFGLAFLSFAGTAGFFDPPSEGDPARRIINSPHEINYILQYFNKFFLFLLPAIMGATIYKDFKYKVDNVLYSFPVPKGDYLLGKFLSSLTVVFFIACGTGLGMVLAEQLPGLHADKVGSFRAVGYLQAYGVYVLPNLLIFGAVVFSVVLWFRNIYAGFATVVFFLLLQIITENAFSNNAWLVALFDPFGQNVAPYLTRFWTLTEQNTQVIPVAGIAVYNRLLWLGLAALVLGITFRGFSFRDQPAGLFSGKRSGRRLVKNNFESIPAVSIPGVAYQYSRWQQLKTSWKLSNVEFRYIVRSWMFLGLALLGVAAVIFALAKVTQTSEMTLMPVTRIVLSVPAFFFTGVVILLTFLYTGMVVHRERSAGMNQLVDVAPLPDWVFLLSKLSAVWKMQALLLGTMMLAGILLQLYHGYTRLEIGLYLFHLFVLTWLVLIIWSLAALLVHVLFPNLYLGLFVLILAWLGLGGLPQVGITTRLLAFDASALLPYSDLNGYGRLLAPFFFEKAYWLTFGLLLGMVAYLFWYRGLPQSWRERFALAKARFIRQVRLITGLFLASWLLLGAGIFREEQKTVAFSAENRKEAFQAFEDKYHRYAGLEQPKITKVRLALDIFPETNRFEATGAYTLVNQSAETIDTLLIKCGFDEDTELELDRPSVLVNEDPYVQFSVRRLQPGLAPGDSLQLNFTIKSRPNTYFERNSNVLRSGTFLRQDILPRLGYFLEAGQRSPEDTAATAFNYQAMDADLLDFEATLSTSADQVALAPGYLRKEWTEGGRRYFRYQTDQPIKLAFGFHSGRWAVQKEAWEEVDLEIHHHLAHDSNVDRMMEGMLASLKYNTRYFGAYEHQSARIVEFPQSEGTYATAYANSIPVSEARFISRADSEGEKVDLAFYIPAHELAHHWWGNQLMPADAHGALMLTESIAEYITLKIYGQQFGPDRAVQFLQLQRQRYLRGRTAETEAEPPLMRVRPHQQYLAYGKGALAFNTLSHYLGEARLNKVLSGFLADHRAPGPPYPVATELVERLKAATPDSLGSLVEDLFETVTFWDNKIKEAQLRLLADGSFEVTLSFAMRKTGPVSGSRPLADHLEIGLFDEDGKTLYLRSHPIRKTDNQVTIHLEKRPSRVVLDPNLLLIDRDLEDNGHSL